MNNVHFHSQKSPKSIRQEFRTFRSWNKSYQVKILLKEIHLNGHHRIFHKLANSKVRTTYKIPLLTLGVRHLSLINQAVLEFLR